jgi:hypothetical protein
MKFINSLPFKDGPGRTLIHYSLPGMNCGVHRDFSARNRPPWNVQMMWLNPLRKPFYVMDSERNKHHIESRIAVFNVHDLHGMDEYYRSAFSVRVNGFYTDEFIEKAGLSDFCSGRGPDQLTI